MDCMISSFSEQKIIKRLQILKDNNLYHFFRKIEQSTASKVVVNGEEKIMIGSNNYLGLTHHPAVMEAAIKAIEKYGTGCTGSRFLNGNFDIHEELEEKLAKFIGHEKVIVFSTGMQSNQGALATICGPRDCMIYDSENHASIIDSSRLNLGTTFKYKHNDMESLEEVIKDNRGRFKKMMIVADGVFSMTGDVAKLPEMVEIAKRYNVLIYIDDAHGLGVMGKAGRGTINHFGMTDQVHFNMGTFSKSFGSIGGFVSGPSEAMEYIKHSARSFIFSASMPPASVATAIACVDLLNNDDSVVKNLWDNVKFIGKGFKELGFHTFGSETPIIPIFIGDEIKAMQVTSFLFEKGIFATPVVSPAVPEKDALIRTSYMACHSKDELQRVLEVFAEAKTKFDIPTKY